MSAYSEFTKSQEKSKLLVFLGLQKIEGTLGTNLKSAKQTAFGLIKANLESKKKRETQEMISNNQFLEEKCENLRGNYRLKQRQIQKLGVNQIKLVLQQVLVRQKKLYFETFREKMQGNFKFQRLIYVISKYQSTNKVAEALQNWKQASTYSNLRQEKNLIIQSAIVKMLDYKHTRYCFRKWKQVCFTQTLESLNGELVSKLRNKMVKRQGMGMKYCFDQLKIESHKEVPLEIISNTQDPELKTQTDRSQGSAFLIGMTARKLQTNQQRYLYEGFTQIRIQSLANAPPLIIKPQKCCILLRVASRIMGASNQSEVLKAFQQIKSYQWVSVPKKESRTTLAQNLIMIVTDLHYQQERVFFRNMKELSILREHQRHVFDRLGSKIKKKRLQSTFLSLYKGGLKVDQQRKQSQRQIAQGLNQLSKIVKQSKLMQLGSFFFETKKYASFIDNQQQLKEIKDKFEGALKLNDLTNNQNSLQAAFRLLSSKSRPENERPPQEYPTSGNSGINNELGGLLRSRILYQLLSRHLNKVLQATFNQLASQSLRKKVEGDIKKLKSKKSEIHNQIVYMTERDIKIRSQETQLQMREAKVLEKEKELKEKQRKVNDQCARLEKKKQESNSRSPQRYGLPAQYSGVHRGEMSKTLVIQKQMEQFMTDKGSFQSQKSKDSGKAEGSMNITQEIEKVTQKLNQINYPLQKQPKEIKVNHQQMAQIGKENSTHTGIQSTKNVIKKQSYLSSSNNFTIGNQTQPAYHTNRQTDNQVKKSVENLKIKMVKSGFDRLQAIFQRNNRKTKDLCLTVLVENTIWERKVEGAKRIQDYVSKQVLSQCLINWIRSTYEEEIELDEHLQNKRLSALFKIVLIVDRDKDHQLQLMAAYFREWKRMGYEEILQDLKQYNQMVSVNIARTFNSKKGSRYK